MEYLKKVRLVIYYIKFKTSNLIISDNSSSSTELLDRTNIVYAFKCPLLDCVSKEENNAYLGLTTTTLSRQLTMHLNDSSSLPLHLKTHSILKSKFWKILVENTTIIAHKINKLWLQILAALHIKTKKSPKINRINFENRDNVLKCFNFFFQFYSVVSRDSKVNSLASSLFSFFFFVDYY